MGSRNCHESGLEYFVESLKRFGAPDGLLGDRLDGCQRVLYAVIEFGQPVRAKVLLSYGNSSQPGSAHYGDQVELFARQEMRDAWRDRKTVEAHLEAREEVH